MTRNEMIEEIEKITNGHLKIKINSSVNDIDLYYLLESLKRIFK